MNTIIMLLLVYIAILYTASYGIVLISKWLWREFKIFTMRRGRGKWKQPWTCRRFGHLFEPSNHSVQSVFGPNKLFICDRCGMGRAAGFGGADYFTPETIQNYLAQVAASDAGKVTPIGKAIHD